MRRKWLRKSLALLAGLWLAGAAPAGAQDDDGPPTGELTLAESQAKLPGRVAMAQGRVDDTDVRYMVGDLSIFRPMAVAVLAERPTDKIKVKIGKDWWDEDFQSGDTEDGLYLVKFRTQGDLKITLHGPPGGTGYRLLVWAGGEVRPDVSRSVVPPSEAGSRWPLPTWALALIGLVLVAGGYLFYTRRRRA